MKHLLKSLILLMGLSLCIIACDSEDDEASPATTNTTNNNGGNNNGGGNTNIGQDFYITGKQNGRTFLSKDDDRFTYVKYQNFFGTGNHQLIGTGDTVGAASMIFQTRNGNGFKGVGRYDFTSMADLSMSWIPGNRQVTYNADERKFRDGWVDGFVDVTFYDSTIIEGTFAFKAVNPDWSDPQNPDYSDSVRITDGRFRLKYK